ncbi:hypothetical protein [Maricaulis maris]|uniref:hypothetical protein n=1 Tax=Maricaulis maris TaxID=74318 RepID=UPI0026F219DD|nr:hypothetical protein [Maricaulis maris]
MTSNEADVVEEIPERFARLSAERLARQVASYRASKDSAWQKAEQALLEMNRLLFLASGAAAGSILIWLADAVADDVPIEAFVLAVVAIGIFVTITFVGFMLQDGYALRQHAFAAHSLAMAHATEELELAYLSAAMAGLKQPTEDIAAPIRTKLAALSNRKPYDFSEEDVRKGATHTFTMWLGKRTRLVLLFSTIGFVLALACTIGAIFWNYLM